MRGDWRLRAEFWVLMAVSIVALLAGGRDAWDGDR